MTLRRSRPLEKITIRELAELAEISKATFYLHYRDIYDLSEQMQDEMIRKILSSIAHPENCISNWEAFTVELFRAFDMEQRLIETLFADRQSQTLPMRIEKELLDFVKKQQPALTATQAMLLTYSINGSYAVYQRYRRCGDPEEIVRIISRASRCLSEDVNDDLQGGAPCST